jgi:hypothetical protein
MHPFFLPASCLNCAQREQEEDRRRARPTAAEEAAILSAEQYLEKVDEARERLSDEPGESIDGEALEARKRALECISAEELKRLLRYVLSVSLSLSLSQSLSLLCCAPLPCERRRVNGYLAENMTRKNMINIIAEGQV